MTLQLQVQLLSQMYLDAGKVGKVLEINTKNIEKDLMAALETCVWTFFE